MTSFCQLKGGGRVWALGDSGGSLSFVSSMLAPPGTLLSQLSLLIMPPERLFLQQYSCLSVHQNWAATVIHPFRPLPGSLPPNMPADLPVTTLGEIS